MPTVTRSSVACRAIVSLLEAAKRRNPLPRGSVAVGLGLLVAGVSAYGFLVVADISLSRVQYAPLSALWGLVFLAGPGLFLPLEQEVSRSIAARRARGEGGAPVFRRAAAIGLGLCGGVVLLLVAVSPWVVDELFDHQLLLLVGFVLGLAGALAGHLARGALSGTGNFRGYATFIGADGFLRFLGALGLFALGVATAGWFGIALGIAPLLAVPIALRVQRPHLEQGPESTWSEVSTALGFLMVASLLSFGIMNIGPVLVKLLASSAQADAAGRFLPGLVIARIPLFLFQAVQAALLPKLSGLAGAGRIDDFRHGLERLLKVVGWLAGLGTLAGFTVAPFVVGVMFPDVDLGSRTLGLLAAGSGFFMLALACAQAVIALGGHRDQTFAWAMGMLTLLATTLLVSRDLFLRVEIGLLVGSAVAFLSMGALLLNRLREASLAPPAPGREDLVEALQGVAAET